MRCLRCGRAIAGVFPGAKVICECGAENVAQASTVDPYRAPASGISPPSRADDVEAAPKKERRHPCPRCQHPLGHAGGGVHACGVCEGTFFAERALEALVERARSDGEVDTAESLQTSVSVPATQGDVRYLPCPMCGERMNRSIFGRKSGIVVDVCPQHGTWFDHGEVEDAVRFARTHDALAPPPKAPLTEEQVQHRAELVGLYERERVEEEVADAAWHARMDGVGLTFIERLANAIRWLRGD